MCDLLNLCSPFRAAHALCVLLTRVMGQHSCARVLPMVQASAQMSTVEAEASKDSLTLISLRGMLWHSGISRLVCFAPMIPARHLYSSMYKGVLYERKVQLAHHCSGKCIRQEVCLRKVEL